MTTRYIILSAAMLLSSTAIADDMVADASIAYTEIGIFQDGLILADTRRGDRRDDRRDCRDEEGVAGKDKRDCKQEDRKGDHGDDDDA